MAAPQDIRDIFNYIKGFPAYRALQTFLSANIGSNIIIWAFWHSLSWFSMLTFWTNISSTKVGSKIPHSTAGVRAQVTLLGEVKEIDALGRHHGNLALPGSIVLARATSCHHFTRQAIFSEDPQISRRRFHGSLWKMPESTARDTKHVCASNLLGTEKQLYELQISVPIS